MKSALARFGLVRITRMWYFVGWPGGATCERTRWVAPVYSEHGHMANAFPAHQRVRTQNLVVAGERLDIAPRLPLVSLSGSLPRPVPKFNVA